MTPVFADHVLFVVLLAVLPLLGLQDIRQLKTEAARGRPDARVRSYRRGLLHEWLPALALVGVWSALGRPAAALGFGHPVRWEHWTILGLGVAGAALGALQMRWLLSRPEGRAKLREGFGPLEAFLPHSAEEGRWFTALGLSAGICEELLYRGFLVAYLASFLGLWPGALAAGAVFGIAHLYQGWGGIVRTGIFGVVFALLYAWSGQLWGLVILHAAVDVLNGRAARVVQNPGQ